MDHGVVHQQQSHNLFNNRLHLHLGHCDVIHNDLHKLIGGEAVEGSKLGHRGTMGSEAVDKSAKGVAEGGYLDRRPLC